jgi:hypothetical protein
MSAGSASSSSRLASNSAATSARSDAGQRQGFPKKFLRSRGHVATLEAAMQPNKRLHPTEADGRAN